MLGERFFLGRQWDAKSKMHRIHLAVDMLIAIADHVFLPAHLKVKWNANGKYCWLTPPRALFDRWKTEFSHLITLSFHRDFFFIVGTVAVPCFSRRLIVDDFNRLYLYFIYICVALRCVFVFVKWKSVADFMINKTARMCFPFFLLFIPPFFLKMD